MTKFKGTKLGPYFIYLPILRLKVTLPQAKKEICQKSYKPQTLSFKKSWKIISNIVTYTNFNFFEFWITFRLIHEHRGGGGA